MIYEGTRGESRCHVTVDGRTLKPRLDLFNHSPTGYEWGYGGSGPAQLALAILAHHFGDDERAVRLHQDFKYRVIARLSQDSWRLTTEQIDDAVKLFDPHSVPHLFVEQGDDDLCDECRGTADDPIHRVPGKGDQP